MGFKCYVTILTVLYFKLTCATPTKNIQHKKKVIHPKTFVIIGLISFIFLSNYKHVYLCMVNVWKMEPKLTPKKLEARFIKLQKTSITVNIDA